MILVVLRTTSIFKSMQELKNTSKNLLSTHPYQKKLFKTLSCEIKKILKRVFSFIWYLNEAAK